MTPTPPIDPRALAEDAAAGQGALCDAFRGRLFGAHTLVADDHAATRHAIGQTLERCGMTATNGSHA